MLINHSEYTFLFMGNNTVFIITGPKGSGKTTFQHQVTTNLKQTGIKIKGFLATHDFQTDSYSIFNIETHQKLLLAQRIDECKYSENPFRFNKSTIEQGKEWLNDIINHPPDLALIDEIGIYELHGKVWSNQFTQICNTSIPILFSTSIHILNNITTTWKLNPNHIFYPTDFQSPEIAADKIREQIHINTNH